MKIKFIKKLKSEKGLLVAPIYKEDLKKTPSIYPDFAKDIIKKLFTKDHLKGKSGESEMVYLGKKGMPEKMLLLCIGEKKMMTASRAKDLGGKIGKHLKAAKIEELTIMWPEELTEFSQMFIEGIMLTQYRFDKYKTKKDKPVSLKVVNILGSKANKECELGFMRAHKISMAVDLTKDLVNFPSNEVDASYIAREARKIAKDNKYKIAIIGEKELKKMEWGALLAVNQGSSKEAKCIVLQYDGGGKKDKPIAIVGKGVIFDTGGVNLKPSGHIETMHQDMAGGAAVLGVFKVLKKLGIKKNVIGVIPAVENVISYDAYRPSDIIKTFSGKTVEVTNTDAEGRLILADAITYAAKLKPESIITIATLTGAVSVALGGRYAGLIGNDDDLIKGLQKAGDAVDDLGWPLPLHADYKKKMDSEVADIRNMDTGSGREAGCSKAAAFLERFVEDNKWCHIDIGGSAFTTDPKPYQGKGATGHGVEMLLKYLES